MAYDVVDLDSLEGEGPGGMVRKLRRALGAQAFGFNQGTRTDRPTGGSSCTRSR